MRQRRLVLAGDQRQLCVVLDPAVEVDEAAVDLGDESRLGEAGADVRGHLGRRHRMRIGTDGAVGKGYGRHRMALDSKRWSDREPHGPTSADPAKGRKSPRLNYSQ